MTQTTYTAKGPLGWTRYETVGHPRVTTDANGRITIYPTLKEIPLSPDPHGRGKYDPTTGLYEWYETDNEGQR